MKMLVRIREPDVQERWLLRCEIMWQPVDSRNGKWYPIYYRNIRHEDPEARRNALNAVYMGHITTVCRAKYDRETHSLIILAAAKEVN